MLAAMDAEADAASVVEDWAPPAEFGEDDGGWAGSALRPALLLLASASPPSWEQVAGLPDIGALQPGNAVGSHRSARFVPMTLSGFGAAVLPDGGVGVDAGTRDGNAGDAGVTFAGDAQAVHLIAVRKSLPETAYARVLRDQLRPTDRLVRQDGVCDEAAGPTGYWLVLEGGAVPLTVSASIDAGGKYDAGFTDFEFRRGQADVQLPRCGD